MKLSKKFTILLFSIISMGIFAQKEMKEGVITQKMTMSSENKQVNAQLAIIGDITVTTFFKDFKTRTDINSTMIGENTTIVNKKTKQILTLTNSPGAGKKYLTTKVDDTLLKNATVKETGDTKTILGYKCKGYDITTKKDDIETKMLMYTTDKIHATNKNTTGFGDKIKGYPLHIELKTSQAGMPLTTTIIATEIKSTEVDDSKFDMTIPDGYEKMEVPK
jgi:hypothetical protein